jgi:hypothetical protein
MVNRFFLPRQFMKRGVMTDNLPEEQYNFYDTIVL